MDKLKSRKVITLSARMKATPKISREIENRRKHIRLSHHFPAKFSKVGLCVPIAGVTENLSQGGAFIRTKLWHAFQIHDQTIVTFYIPPTFSGHDATIGLQGIAVVARVDAEREGIAVRFHRNFKRFKKVHQPPVSVDKLA